MPSQQENLVSDQASCLPPDPPTENKMRHLHSTLINKNLTPYHTILAFVRFPTLFWSSGIHWKVCEPPSSNSTSNHPQQTQGAPSSFLSLFYLHELVMWSISISICMKDLAESKTAFSFLYWSFDYDAVGFPEREHVNIKDIRGSQFNYSFAISMHELSLENNRMDLSYFSGW